MNDNPEVAVEGGALAPPMTAPVEAKPSPAPNGFWGPRALMAAVLVATIVLRARMLDVPLERDEGAYGYIGRTLLQGLPLYRTAVDMKMPGLYYAYAGLMAVFRPTATGIRMGLLAVNLATVWFVFLLGRRLYDETAGVVAAAAFSMVSLSRTMLGFAANAEHYVLLPALAGVLFVLRAEKSKRSSDWLLSGVFMSLGFMIKQQGVFFIAFAGACLAYGLLRERPLFSLGHARKVGVFAFGAFLPFAFFCLLLARRGVLGEFFYWAIRYSSGYAAHVPLSAAAANLAATFFPILSNTWIFWALAAVGLLTLWIDPRTRGQAVFFWAFAGFSFLSVCPGLYFRHHYFLLLIPAVALLAGGATRSISRFVAGALSSKAGAAAAILLTLAIVGQVCSREADYLFQLDPKQVNRLIYGGNPFVESLEIARFIQERTTPRDRVAVLGSEPEILFYADRLSATRHIVMYPLMWAPREMAGPMQSELIREIETAKPKIVVFVNIPASWSVRTESEKKIFAWANQYCNNYCQLVGIVEIPFPQPTVYVWGDATLRYSIKPRPHLLIFQRKAAPASAPASFPAPASAPAASAPAPASVPAFSASPPSSSRAAPAPRNGAAE